MNKISGKRVLEGLEPEKVFYYFEELSKIPRESGNEKAVSDYVLRLARMNDLEAIQDGAWNVIVNLPASEGWEEKKKTILQAHLDMVCVKESECTHDFKNDALKLYIENEEIKAEGTSLGADDGIGVALMLAVMMDKTLKHPPMQMLFTTGEEILFTGALALNANLLKGEQMIGLDCSSSDIIVASCAGISIHEIELTCHREPVLNLKKKLFRKVRISNLSSGHSGNMIHLGRASAIKMMGCLLSALAEKSRYDLIQLHCPGKINVISKEAEAVIAFDIEKAQEMDILLDRLCAQARSAYRRTEPEMKIDIELMPSFVTNAAHVTKLSEASLSKLLSLMELLPFGANSMIDDSGTMAESSVNPGSLIENNNRYIVEVSIRSNSEYHHDNLVRRLRHISEAAGAEYKQINRAAGWEYNPASDLLKKAEKVFLQCNGKPAEVKMLHASVEAGVLVGKRRENGCNLDVINIGADISGPHTTSEMVNITSVKKVWNFLTRLLEEIG